MRKGYFGWNPIYNDWRNTGTVSEQRRLTPAEHSDRIAVREFSVKDLVPCPLAGAFHCEELDCMLPVTSGTLRAKHLKPSWIGTATGRRQPLSMRSTASCNRFQYRVHLDLCGTVRLSTEFAFAARYHHSKKGRDVMAQGWNFKFTRPNPKGGADLQGLIVVHVADQYDGVVWATRKMQDAVFTIDWRLESLTEHDVKPGQMLVLVEGH